MNVSFSTRGWQQIPWEQQVQMAETMRFGGVELYNVHKTPELTGFIFYPVQVFQPPKLAGQDGLPRQAP